MKKYVITLLITALVACIYAVTLSLLSATYEAKSMIDGGVKIITGYEAVSHYINLYGLANYLRGLVGQFLAFSLFSYVSTLMAVRATRTLQATEAKGKKNGDMDNI